MKKFAIATLYYSGLFLLSISLPALISGMVYLFSQLDSSFFYQGLHTTATKRLPEAF
jgi:hypothetical protein